VTTVFEKDNESSIDNKGLKIEPVRISKDTPQTPEDSTSGLTSNLIEGHALDIIEKVESKIPTYVKLYSDLYKKYLHIMNNFCNISLSSQKETFGKMGVDVAVFTMFDSYLRSVKKMVLLQIDLNENIFRNYVGYRLSVLDFYDQMLNSKTVNFARLFEAFNDSKKQ